MTDEVLRVRNERSAAILANFEKAKQEVSSAAASLKEATKALRELLAEDQRNSDDSAQQ